MATASHPDSRANPPRSSDEPRRRPGLIVGLVALAWLPLLLLSGFGPGAGVDPLLLRAEPHVRMLIALLVLLSAEPALDERIAMVVRDVPVDVRLRPLDRERWDDTLHRIRRWRDAKLFELCWLAVIYGELALAYFDRLPDRTLRWSLSSLHSAQWGEATPAWWWYVLVSQPLLLLWLGRWLYRWLLWTVLVWRLARLQPDVQVAHGDGVGGFAVLRLPLTVLPWFLLAVGSAIAAVWFDEIASGEAEVATFAMDLLGFLLVGAGLVLVPYLLLTPRLVRARELGMLEWSALAHRCAAEFEQCWLARGEQEHANLLARPDVSTLADLCTVTRSVEQMRVLVPSAKDLKSTLLVAVLPFLLVVLAQGTSAVQLIRSAAVRFIGG